MNEEIDPKSIIDEVIGPDEEEQETAYQLNRKKQQQFRNLNPNRWQEQQETINKFIASSLYNSSAPIRAFFICARVLSLAILGIPLASPNSGDSNSGALNAVSATCNCLAAFWLAGKFASSA